MISPNGLQCDGYSSVEWLYNNLPESVRDDLKPMLDNDGSSHLYPCYLKRLPIPGVNKETWVVRLMGKNFGALIPIKNKAGKINWFHAVTMNLPIDFDINNLYEFKE